MATRFGAHWSVTCYDDVIAAFDVTYSGVFTNSVRGRGAKRESGDGKPPRAENQHVEKCWHGDSLGSMEPLNFWAYPVMFLALTPISPSVTV